MPVDLVEESFTRPRPLLEIGRQVEIGDPPAVQLDRYRLHQTWTRLAEQRQMHLFLARKEHDQELGRVLSTELPRSLDGVDEPARRWSPDILSLNLALEKLHAIDPRLVRVVELRYFGGLTVDEAAAVLEVAAITVKRDWAMARTWLFRELGGAA